MKLHYRSQQRCFTLMRVLYTLQTFPFAWSRAPRLLEQTDRSLWETWNNNEAFTSLQSLRPQGHNIWDRNRTGGSESSSTVEKVISHGCYCRIERHSFCHRPTTCQIKSEKSRFKMGSDVSVTSKCCLWTKTASLFLKKKGKKGSYMHMCLFLVT